MLDVRIVRKYQRDYPQLMKSINKLFLNQAGVIVQGDAISNSPVDTGRLRSSIKYKVNLPQDQVSVGTNVSYAPYVEYGTIRMKAQPYLRKALDFRRRELIELWRSLFRRTFRAMGKL